MAQSDNAGGQPAMQAGPTSEKGKGHGWGRSGKKGQRCGVKGELGLSDQQKEQLKALHQTFRQQNASTIEAMKTRKQELRQLGNDPANAQRRDELKAALRADKQALSAQRRGLMQQVLTPQQLAQYDAKREQCRQQWQQKKQNRPAKPGA